jgi:hypothetical protein
MEIKPINDHVAIGFEMINAGERTHLLLDLQRQLDADFDHMVQQQETINELRAKLAGAEKIIKDLENKKP